MNIYVGNLPFNLGEEDLKEIFEEYGEVASSKIISDKFSGRSKGFGFIEMDSDDDANNAIKELNNAEVGGRNIKVNESKPREDRGGDRRGGGGGGYQRRDRYQEAMKGTVKWYDAVKGYGFIQSEDDKDLFVHRSGVKDNVFSLEAGQAVEFEIKESDKGPVAFNVEVV